MHSPTAPPRSTTSLPSESDFESAASPAIGPPLLASDILREEIAPLAPARFALRALLVPLAAGFAGCGVACLAGWVTPSDHLWVSGAFVTAAAAALAGLAPAPYAARAGLATIAALLPLVLGARGQAALACLAFDGRREAAAGVVLATLLPAALFFRSQYRAFLAARVVLAGALVLSGPAAFFFARQTLAEGTPLALRVIDGLMMGATLTSLGGFLGPETTGACTAWGALVLVTYAGRIFLASWLEGGKELSSAIGAALGGGLAATVVGVGVYQLLAVLLARRARLVDVHRIVGPSAEEEG
jgi:hypothetical protein